MNHETFASRLDDYVDGTLPSAERVELEAHIATCADCAATLSRLRALLDAARQLPPSVAPARDLWPDLRERLAAAAAPAATSAARAPGRRHVWTPAVVLAAAAIVVLLAASVWYSQRVARPPAGGDVAIAPRSETAPSPNADSAAAQSLGNTSATPYPDGASDAGIMPAVVAAFERECMGAGRSLQASLEGRSTPADEAMLRSVAAGIETLDQSIAETRAALASNVDDVALMKLLTVRYQQKLALLQGAITIMEEV